MARYFKYLAWELLSIPLAILTRLFKGHGKYIIFGSNGGRGYADNSRYLFEELFGERFENIFWLTNSSAVRDELREKNYPVLYCWSIKGIYVSIRARLVVYCFDIYDVNPYAINKSARTINLWHGVSPKKLGRLNEHSYLYNPSTVADVLKRLTFRRKLLKPDIFVTPTADLVDFYSHAFGLSNESILLAPYPRTQYLLKKRSERKESGNGKPTRGRLKILWTPTLRDRGDNELFSEQHFQALSKVACKLDLVIGVKPHPAQKIGAGQVEYANLEWLNPSDDLYESLANCDCVMTDISSIIIECQSAEIPVLIYFPDLEEYSKRERSLTVPLEDYLGRISINLDEVSKELRQLEQEGLADGAAGHGLGYYELCDASKFNWPDFVRRMAD